ncbi:putative membrane protein C14C4.07 [Mycena indigotica]|uniref:Putative membrane protein C14C4.07 n=1 Tax=Mycena indigotica TaxID=2126181 RepID=A0A8H6W9E4_9AGAR|nr:putative membrane protein C14C4.07 [Mycena indigotica]KAF7304044.1 putative membrane protein C14C4.07 [Mycena indigotica]
MTTHYGRDDREREARETDALLPRREDEDDRDSGKAGFGLGVGGGFTWLLGVLLLSSVARGASMHARFEHYQDEFCPTSHPDSPCGYFAPYFHLPGFTLWTDFTSRFAAFVVSFVSIGFWSQLGDTRGRRPVLLGVVLGTVVFDLLFHAVALAGPALGEEEKRDVLSIAFIVQGLLGGWPAFFGAVNAYTVDVARPSSRLVLFGIVEAVGMVGVVFGGALGAAIRSFRYTYLFSALLGAVNAGIVWRLLPDSKPQPPTDRYEHVQRREESLVASVFVPFTVLFPGSGKALPLLGVASYAYSLTGALETSMLRYTELYAYPGSSGRTPILWVIYLLPRILTLATLLLLPRLLPRSPRAGLHVPHELTRTSLLLLLLLPLTITLFCARVGDHTGAPVLYAVCALLLPSIARLPALGTRALAVGFLERAGRGRDVGTLMGALALWAELGAAISYVDLSYAGAGMFMETGVWAFIALVCVMPDPPAPVPVAPVGEGERRRPEA